MLIFFVFGLCESLSFRFENTLSSRCFKVYSEPGQKITLSYLISGVDEKSVQVSFVDPSSKQVFSNTFESSRKNSFEPKIQGKYTLCFKSLSKSLKEVSFEFYSEKEISDSILQEEFSPIRDKLEQTSKKLISINRNLEFIVQRKKIYNIIIKATSDKILWHSGLKLVMVLVLSFLKLFILTRLFITNKHTNV